MMENQMTRYHKGLLYQGDKEGGGGQYIAFNIMTVTSEWSRKIKLGNIKGFEC